MPSRTRTWGGLGRVKAMKVKFSFIVILIAIVVVGCQNSVLETPTVISPTPSQHPTSRFTPSSTPTLPPSLTPTASVTPYPTFPSYTKKDVIFSYSIYGNHGSFDGVLGYAPHSSIVLYSDGRLIISGKPYRQKHLSGDEINRLFSQLEIMGFYSLKTNQKHDPTDLLYDFKGQFEETYDGLYICVMDVVKNREICVRDHLREFLIQPMKDILQFLDNYEPTGMSVYQADRLLLSIEAQPPTWSIIEDPEVIPWPVNFPDLGTDKWQLSYIEGDEASQLFSLYGSHADARLVNANGVEYYVIVRPVLPHETLSWYR
jgi:hypothetical protein